MRGVLARAWPTAGRGLAVFRELVAIRHPEEARVNAAAILIAIGGILTLQSITSYLVHGSTLEYYGPGAPDTLTTVLVTLLPLPMYLVAWQVYRMPQRRVWSVGLPGLLAFVAAGGCALTLTYDDTGGAQLMLALAVLYSGYQLRTVGAWVGTGAVMAASAIITLSVSAGPMALVNISLMWATFWTINYAAIAARRAQDRSMRQLRAQAETDGLTGLATRGLLDRRARLALESSGNGTALLIIDVDFLKALNDTRGHVAGDALLRHVAELVACGIRPADTAGRLGGDEIAVLMPGLTSQDAQARGTALFELVSSSSAALPDGATIPVQISAGLGHVRCTGPITQSQLYTVADRALYRAKRQGRANMCTETVLLQTLSSDLAGDPRSSRSETPADRRSRSLQRAAPSPAHHEP